MKKIIKIVLFSLLGLAVVWTFYGLWAKSKPKTENYEIVTAHTGEIKTTSIATGKLSPRDEILIKPQVPGIISELRKKAGDYVRAGEVIATVKVIPEMATLNSAESRVRVAEINLEQLRSDHARQKTLFAKDIISAQEMETTEANYKKAVEELTNARNNLDIVKEGMSKQTQDFSNTQIRSTIDGMILDIPVKVGNSVIQSNTFNDGTTIASVADMNDMIFIGNVDETEVGRVRTGMPIKLTIGALDEYRFDAILEYISPKGVETNGAVLFEIKAAAQIPDSVEIKAGYSANAEILLAQADGVLIIPESALEFSGDSTFVHLLSDTLASVQKFDRTYIRTGLSDGINVEIKEGLTEGNKLRGNLVVPDKNKK